MAHINKVWHSINSEDGHLCVDVFQRPDGSFGFEEFRRDSEDARGWFPIGHHGHAPYPSAEAALAAAKMAVAWLP